jgi:hypothetical protein
MKEAAKAALLHRVSPSKPNFTPASDQPKWLQLVYLGGSCRLSEKNANLERNFYKREGTPTLVFIICQPIMARTLLGSVENTRKLIKMTRCQLK